MTEQMRRSAVGRPMAGLRGTSAVATDPEADRSPGSPTGHPGQAGELSGPMPAPRFEQEVAVRVDPARGLDDDLDRAPGCRVETDEATQLAGGGRP